MDKFSLIYASHQLEYISNANNSLYWHSERAIQMSTSLKLTN